MSLWFTFNTCLCGLSCWGACPQSHSGVEVVQVAWQPSAKLTSASNCQQVGQQTHTHPLHHPPKNNHQGSWQSNTWSPCSLLFFIIPLYVYIYSLILVQLWVLTQTSTITMGNCYSSSATRSSSSHSCPVTVLTQGQKLSFLSNVASISKSLSRMPAHGATQQNYELATLSPKHDVATPKCMRFKNPFQNPTLLQCCHDNRDGQSLSFSSDPCSHLFRPHGPQLQKSILDATFS